ncbi:MAG: putative lipid II flippase FtsW [Aquabacterium sp.]
MTALARLNPLPRLLQAVAHWREQRDSRQARAVPIRDWSGAGRPTRIGGHDMALVGVVFALLALSLVMVYSASIALPDSRKFANYAPTHFLMRQAVAIGIGLVLAAVALRIPVARWEQAAPWLFAGALVLLALVLLPMVGKGANGARRWMPLGPINFQPSELAKLAMALYAASYMVRKMDVKERFVKAVWPMAVALAVVGLLLLAEPDMGAYIVIASIALGILFLGGVNGRMFILSCLVLLTAFALMIALSPWRRERIFAFMDPWDPVYAQGKGYQLTHSLIAFGRGELTGQGLGESLEKLHYLPEAHTDFVLAVIGEELGFIGVLAVICAFFWLTRRIFAIGRQAVALDRVFAGLAVQGIGIWVGVQALINIGVNLGALPTKGLTLPLLSYGGSAILLTLLALGIVLRVDAENRALMRGGRA